MALVQKKPWAFKINGQDKLAFEYDDLETVEQRVQWIKRLIDDIRDDHKDE
jgi:transcription-repair coupling factor (superfamily II helicase)